MTLREAWLTNVLNPKATIFYLTMMFRFWYEADIMQASSG